MRRRLRRGALVSFHLLPLARFAPAKQFGHPCGYLACHLARLPVVVVPARATNHDVVEVHGPLRIAEMFDCASIKRWWSNAAELLCLSFRDDGFRRRAANPTAQIG